eukprot:499867-Prorocentrum_lima.AAC.1
MPIPPQTSMSHSGATHGVGSESIVNRMAQRKVVCPKHFHSRNISGFEPPLRPPSSAAAASSSS